MQNNVYSSEEQQKDERHTCHKKGRKKVGGGVPTGGLYVGCDFEESPQIVKLAERHTHEYSSLEHRPVYHTRVGARVDYTVITRK